MACCLTAPSHYLNQCWLIISKVLWHSSEDIIVIAIGDDYRFAVFGLVTKLWLKFQGLFLLVYGLLTLLFSCQSRFEDRGQCVNSCRSMDQEFNGSQLEEIQQASAGKYSNSSCTKQCMFVLSCPVCYIVFSCIPTHQMMWLTSLNIIPTITRQNCVEHHLR